VTLAGLEALPAAPLTYLPSPTQGVWHLGPFPVRAYALCILVGIVVAVMMTERRLKARGARDGLAYDVSVWAVPFGIVGGRVYHVITTPGPYWGSGGHPLKALAIWEGGLGIWGAIALGAIGAWIGCRRHNVPWPAFADAAAPGILVAQGIGRLGNWFNNELYGRATDLPWGLTIHEWHLSTGRAVTEDGTAVVLGHYHPTFLYESLWAFAGAAFLVWADRRFTLGHGRVFALYMIVYTLGRSWIEALRVDEAEHILGLRLNLWTCAIVLLVGVIGFVVSARRHPGREDLRAPVQEDAPDEAGSYPDS
jgi:prolipoprotein diacylglyceryl transferase